MITNDVQLMRQIADNHNKLDGQHHCLVYGNFIDCPCGFHAHLTGHHDGKMIQHNSNYTFIQYITA